MATLDTLVERVRRKIKDYPELNKLLDNEKENLDQDIKEALESALDVFNATIPPITTYSYSNMPAQIILVHLAIVELLISNSILASRNRFVYSDGKIGGIDTELKAGPYAEWATRLAQLWYQRALSVKVSMNLSQIGDSISSDYAGSPYDETEF